MSFQLYEYQVPAAEHLVEVFRRHKGGLDASSPGCGKTAVASWVARELGWKPLVICPLVVRVKWETFFDLAGIEGWAMSYGKARGKPIPGGPTAYIFDEAHSLGGERTQQARLGIQAKRTGKPVLMLSATLATTPLKMKTAGYILDLFPDPNRFYPWAKRNGCKKGYFGGLTFNNDPTYMAQIAAQIFPDKGVRLRADDLPGFPEQQVTVERLELKEYREIEEAYTRAVEETDNALTLLIRGRQAAERAKIPSIIELVENAMEEGLAPIVFCNFRETLHALAEKFPKFAYITGENPKEREQMREEFQSDKRPGALVATQAGGVGLDLHDIRGEKPRITFLNPSFSAVEFLQAVGRTRRAGAKSKSLVRVLIAAKTVEEKVAKAIEKKLACLDSLNDFDLDPSRLNESHDSRSILPVLNTQSYPCDNPAEPNTNSESTLSTPTTLSSTPGDTASNKESSAPQTASTTSKPVSPDAITSGVQLGKTSDRAHAKHSPSSLKMKAVCPGYRNEESKEPNKYSDRGTRAHEACEKMTSAGLEDDPSLKDAVDKCISYTRRFIREGSKFLPEQKLRVLDQFGFADLIIINGNVAELIDFKFTHNRYPASGPQFRAYCVGIWDKWPEIEKVNVRVPHPFLSYIDEESYNRAEHYEQFVAEIVAIVEAAEREDPATFRVNSGCTYCARAGKCPALAKLGVEVASRYADQEIVLPEGSLHGSEITDPLAFAKLLPAAQIIEKAAGGWRNAAREIALEQEIPGYQIVHTTGKRRCSNASVAWDVVKQLGVTPEEFAEHAEIGIGALEDLVSSRAPRGQKEQAKQKLEDQLRDRDALEVSQGGFFLKQQKTKQ